jgi:hypothetical protein
VRDPEQPVDQEIDYIITANLLRHSETLGVISDAETYQVGYDGVTRIEAFTKAGMYADIPYVRVWRGSVALAEFCQHNIVGVYFKEPA